MMETNQLIDMIQGKIDSNIVKQNPDLAKGIIDIIIGLNIGEFKNFNDLNYHFMLKHLQRNTIAHKEIISIQGMNTTEDGKLFGTQPQKPSYTKGNNYIDTITTFQSANNSGQLTTRVNNSKSNLYQVNNMYFDIDTDVDDNGEHPSSMAVVGTGKSADLESIIMKTKRLWRDNKIKTIISDFHTKGVKYTGQAGSVYGESHGNNVLRYNADPEKGICDPIDSYGYDNPYCRVWTHRLQMDRYSRGLRADSNDLNYWGDNFEWTEDEIKIKNPNGENYDYAWRGKQNQDRRKENSVLDTDTGLVTITPKYQGGQSANIHTKSCMFSIENLAWKDYDPYSFEQALSWEQRGPLGGRIMWFPPYGISVTETTSANWNGTDFIGRGEKVYTYVNSERKGNLSFIMLCDHPSSVDYSHWYDDADTLNSHNDYLRYFAGCNTGKPKDGIIGNNTSNNDGNNNGTNDGFNNDMLIKRPPSYTDEYPEDPGKTLILGEPEAQPDMTPQQPVNNSNPSKTDDVVEFFIFFPNNYSGAYDAPNMNNADVNAISYLLFGKNAMHVNGNNGGTDISIDEYGNNNGVFYDGQGYEMGRGPITDTDAVEKNKYIHGSINQKQYTTKKNERIWQYRIDAKKDSKGNYTTDIDGYKNCICEKLVYNNNYSDKKDYRTNLSINDKVKELTNNKDNLYSFAEVACAFYSETVRGNHEYKTICDELASRNVDNEKVNELIEIFSDEGRKLSEIEVVGMSNSHANNKSQTVNEKRNKALATNRARTAINWIRTYNKWKNVRVNGSDNYEDITDDKLHVSVKVNNEDSKNVSGETAKLYRCAHVKMTFTTTQTVSEAQTSNDDTDDSETTNSSKKTYKEYLGFRYMNSVPRQDGTVWNYYQRDPSYKYYEQIATSDEGHTTTAQDDITVTEQQIYDMLGGYKLYDCNVFEFKEDDWTAIDDVDITELLDTDKGYSFSNDVNNIDIKSVVKRDNTYQVCVKVGHFDEHEWSSIKDLDDNMQIMPNEYVKYFGDIYQYVGSDTLTFEYDSSINPDEIIDREVFTKINVVNDFNVHNTYSAGSIVKYGNGYYYADSTINPHDEFSDDISDVFINIVKTDNCPDGTFDKMYSYREGCICMHDNKYYICNVDFCEKYYCKLNWYGYTIINKASEVLGKKFEQVMSKLLDVNIPIYELPKNTENCLDTIWEYGKWEEGYINTTNVNPDIILFDIASNARQNGRHTTTLNEDLFINTQHDNDSSVGTDDIYKFIAGYQLLSEIKYVKFEDYTRDVTNGSTNKVEEMVLKSGATATPTDCLTDIWVDMGDGILIQECNITNPTDEQYYSDERKTELNKLRYDQEYHFYKKYAKENPVVWEKLTDKIKYFDPVFHSMTPEGFNARLTFLQQCTRQGNTKTMSDTGGNTANNLAFGRPPFCVLRLGDFYNQMIVINSISQDYSVSDGMQWDLNPEGNGVQPMICKISIDFTFIGGGDITGPVRRLQNAMSFNYYANTSFYDNRADRVVYQPTNYKTMGGAGNNEIDYEKSYAYQPKMYQEPKNKIIRIKDNDN